jgi:hypothetical protein
MQGTKFMEKDDLLAEVRAILNEISGKVLKPMSVEWEMRMQTCIDAGGESLENIIIDNVTQVQQANKGVDRTSNGISDILRFINLVLFLACEV